MIKKDSTIQLPLYKSGGFYGLRVPALSIHTFFQASAHALSCDSSEAQQENFEALYQTALEDGYEDVEQLVFHSSFFQTALATASIDIVEGLTRLQKNRQINTRSKRLHSRLLRYLIRMSTRSTPFGLFSGVSLGYFSDTTLNTLQEPAIAHVHIRPDMHWLLSLIQVIEQPGLTRSHIMVMVNCTAYVAGARVIIPYADIYGKKDSRTISLRCLPILKYILEKYHQPLVYTDLVQDLQDAFPHIEKEKIHHFLGQLWDAHVLIGTLRPPLTNVEPGKYLVEQLGSLPETSSLRDELLAILTCMDAINQQGVPRLQDDIRSLFASQQKLIPAYHHQPAHIDAILNMSTTSTIHRSIAEAAARAAEILLKVGKAPTGLHSLAQYRRAFVEKYGEAEVKLLDILSPENGLGVPATYGFPPRTYPLPVIGAASKHDHARDRVLCSLFASTMNTSAKVLHLTDTQLDELTQWTPEQGNAPPASLDVFLQIQASSEEDISRGTWESIVVHSLTFGGRSMSRFAHVFDKKGSDVLREFIRQEEMLFPDTIYAELNFLPPDSIHANMIIHPAFHMYEIAVNTAPSRSEEYMVHLDDLVVGVHKNRLYVRSLRLGKEIKVFQRNMLNERYTPNVCRFLLEVTYDGSPYPGEFDWGLLSEAPFLPRVTYQNIVLSVAKWNICLSDVHPGEHGEKDVHWFTALQRWRIKWNVPRYVYLSHLDNRLLLDLANPLHVQELLTELKKEKCLQLQEMLPDFTHLWLHDTKNAPYVAELTVPVVLNSHYPAFPFHAATDLDKRIGLVKSSLHMLGSHERRYLPNSRWKYLKLYGAPHFQDELIAGPIRAIVRCVREKQLCDRWFYLRYNDPDPHIRIRFHAVDNRSKDTLLLLLTDWGSTLVKEGYINNVCVDSYDQEIERYGGTFYIEEMERFFSINSDTTSALLVAQSSKDVQFDPLITAVFSLDQLFAYWNMDFLSRLRYCQTRTQPYETIESFRAHRTLLMELLFPWKMEQDTDCMKQRLLLLSILSLQQPIIAPIATSMHSLLEQEAIWRPEEGILASLAHMQINRFLGTDRIVEQKVYAFWRHTLESVKKRPGR